MLVYTLKRLLSAIPTILVVIAVSFFMMRLAPGGPFTSDRNVTPAIEANLNAKYNLDDPLIIQFFKYMGNVLQGDFGPSFKYQDFTVTELVLDGLPVSATLGLSSLALAMMVGSFLGVMAALRQNKPTDYGVMTVAMAGITIPNFVTAPVMVLLFAVWNDWLPTAGWVGWDRIDTMGGDAFIKSLILPVITLALPQIAIISRLMRGSMIEVMRSNFIRTAKAKGLSSGTIVRRHALRAAILPLISYLGPATAALLSGSLVIERIFALPGIGQYFVTGALNRDYTLVMGVVILYATLIVMLNLIADLIIARLDPKVKLS
ncbi:oligopeptide ABC transporter permease OppB [Aquisalinus flavus]|uniref:ABC transporter n=1 Tax=Aquisalinus flavus TaxID=1526572 RepID=A0A8J2Y7N5_9PROT|nr:oligopeptide ABC transporter permease OppB [Aquisalinus flavus]MBD0425337.1 oligopeptide ABC transporter permease OppB [Aquisalinus flavus]UNE49012.1 oligopeptide ABC transporter permease OppB [Aquisalinus flavus]GGD16892.1 ABC transporter [Aquisalinus flavus]